MRPALRDGVGRRSQCHQRDEERSEREKPRLDRISWRLCPHARPEGKQARNQRRDEEATDMAMGITRAVGAGDGCADEQRDREPKPAAELTMDECREERGTLGGCAISDGPDDRDRDDEAKGVDDEQRCHAPSGAPRMATEIFRGLHVRRGPVGLGRYDGDERRGRPRTPVLRGTCTRSPRSRGRQGHQNQLVTGSKTQHAQNAKRNRCAWFRASLVKLKPESTFARHVDVDPTSTRHRPIRRPRSRSTDRPNRARVRSGPAGP